MSKNCKRSRMHMAHNSREYNVFIYWKDLDVWADDFYIIWRKGGLYPGQIRSYKTWKHNRRNQWRDSSTG